MCKQLRPRVLSAELKNESPDWCDYLIMIDKYQIRLNDLSKLTRKVNHGTTRLVSSR